MHKSKNEQDRPVEVTPAMIEAGEALLWQFDADYSDAAVWAKRIYRAMAGLAPSKASAP